MKLNIRVAGPAGAGMNSTADIIAISFANLGFEVLTNIEYQSIIKGGLNHFDINISQNSKSLSKFVDVFLCLDDKNLENNLKFLKKEAFIITNKKNILKLREKSITFEKYNILDLEINEKYDNIHLLAILFKLFDLDLKDSFSGIEEIFSKKGDEIIEKNKEIIKNIYKNYKIEKKLSIPKNIGKKKKISYGNKMLAYGAIAGGLEFYAAYPMTPATSILTEIINSKKVKYLQAEDEIAVIHSALGASFAGARSMVGTSSGGFALMSEAFSYALQAEIPTVAVLSQRAGPSTGTPTCLEQADFNFALNPTFGDFEHIVLIPSSLENGYLTAGLALNLAWKYQTIVIILTDKQFSEGKSTISALKSPKIEYGKLEKNPSSDFKRYEITEDGISPYTKVGTKNGEFIAPSYEHDEYGATSENSEIKKKMTEKRARKLQDFFKKENIKGYEIYNKYAKKMFITTSFISYTIRDFIEKNSEYGLIVINFLKPLDFRLKDEIKNKSEIIFVEHNLSGQLESYLSEKLDLKNIKGLKIKNMRKYNLESFYIEDFEDLVYTSF